MTTQSEFKFRSAHKKASDEDIRMMEFFLLHVATGWTTAKEIARVLLLKNDRIVRSIAEHSKGQIVSGPGCAGYKHLSNCTQEELCEVASRLESQARHMQARAVQIRRNAHAMIR